MIEFSNKHKMTFCCASGALGFDGRGWIWEYLLRWLGVIDPKTLTIVSKTVTLEPKKGNLSKPWSCVKFLSNCSVVNSVGLSNPGVRVWIDKYYKISIQKGYNIAVSVKVDNLKEARIVAGILRGLKLAYVEVNLSCPNTEEVSPEVLAELKECDHPIVLKLSRNQINSQYINYTDNYVEAYHAINSVPWNDIFPETKSPLAMEYGNGGVSGKAIHKMALNSVKELKDLTNKPIIGGGGIFHFNDVLSFEEHGANAFSIGTCFLLKPWRPKQIIRRYQRKYF